MNFLTDKLKWNNVCQRTSCLWALQSQKANFKIVILRIWIRNLTLTVSIRSQGIEVCHVKATPISYTKTVRGKNTGHKLSFKIIWLITLDMREIYWIKHVMEISLYYLFKQMSCQFSDQFLPPALWNLLLRLHYSQKQTGDLWQEVTGANITTFFGHHCRMYKINKFPFVRRWLER